MTTEHTTQKIVVEKKAVKFIFNEIEIIRLLENEIKDKYGPVSYGDIEIEYEKYEEEVSGFGCELTITIIGSLEELK